MPRRRTTSLANSTRKESQYYIVGFSITSNYIGLKLIERIFKEGKENTSSSSSSSSEVRTEFFVNSGSSLQVRFLSFLLQNESITLLDCEM